MPTSSQMSATSTFANPWVENARRVTATIGARAWVVVSSTSVAITFSHIARPERLLVLGEELRQDPPDGREAQPAALPQQADQPQRLDVAVVVDEAVPRATRSGGGSNPSRW